MTTTMTHGQMAERMGSDATCAEGMAMIEILEERGLELDDLTDEQFFALIPEAIDKAARAKREGIVTDAGLIYPEDIKA